MNLLDLPLDLLISIACCIDNLPQRNVLSLVCKRLHGVAKEDVLYKEIVRRMWGQDRLMRVHRSVLTPTWKQAMQYRMCNYPSAYRQLFATQSYLTPRTRTVVLQWLLESIRDRFKKHQHALSRSLLCQVIAVSVFDRFVCSKANKHEYCLQTIAAAAYIFAKCNGELQNVCSTEYDWVAGMTDAHCSVINIYLCSLTMNNTINYEKHIYKKWYCGYMQFTCNRMIQERDFCVLFRVLRMLQSLNNDEVTVSCIKLMRYYLMSDLSIMFSHEQAAVAIVSSACVHFNVPALLRDSACAQFDTTNERSDCITQCSRHMCVVLFVVFLIKCLMCIQAEDV